MKHLKIIAILISIWTGYGCYENIEGCSNPAASNFNIETDRSCCCCCEYPDFQFNAAYKINDSTRFLLNTDYLDANAQPFQVQQMHLIISQAAVLINGQWIAPQDTLSTFIFDPNNLAVNMTVDNSMGVLKRTDPSLSLGTFATLGNIDSIRFRIGLSDQQQLIIPDSLATDHPLQNDSLYLPSEKIYASQRWIIATDTSNQTLRTIKVTEPIDIQLDSGASYAQTEGAPLNININIQVLDWLKDISWLTDSDDEIEQHIINNALDVINFTP